MKEEENVSLFVFGSPIKPVPECVDWVAFGDNRMIQGEAAL